jgi:hypothetical protein
MRMDNAPHPEAEGRRVGVPLARPLTGRIGKERAKGVLQNKCPAMGINAAVGEGK